MQVGDTAHTTHHHSAVLFMSPSTIILLLTLLILCVGWSLAQSARSSLTSAHETTLQTSPGASNHLESSVDQSSSSSSTTDSQSGDASNTNTTNIEVNGQHMDVPANGELHTTINQDGTTTKIDVSNSSTNSGSKTSSRSKVTVKSSSSSKTVTDVKD